MRSLLLLLLCLSIVSLASAQGVAPPAGVWTTVSAGGFPASTQGYNSGTFVPDNGLYSGSTGRVMFLDNYFHYSSEPNYCVNGWSYKENRWDIFDCSTMWHNPHTMEAGHTNGTFWFTGSTGAADHTNLICYWGGLSGSNQAQIVHHPWCWDPLGRTGRDWVGWGVSGNSGVQPGNVGTINSVYDSVNDKFVFFADQAGKTEVQNLTTHVFTIPSVTGTTAPDFTGVAYDSTNGTVWSVGGWATQIGNCGVSASYISMSSASVFNEATNTWTNTSIAADPTNGTPNVRGYHGFAYDKDDDVFLLTGGEYNTGSGCTLLNDTWEIINPESAPTWHRLHAATSAGTWTAVTGPTTTGGVKYTTSNNYFLESGTLGDTPFWRLTYIGNHTFVFIKGTKSADDNTIGVAPYTGGTMSNYTARLWIYCLDGQTCPNIGSTTNTYNNPSGASNRQEQGLPSITPANETWAEGPAIFSTGSLLYAAWAETQNAPFASAVCGPGFHHVTVQNTADNQSWSAMGSACSGVDPRMATTPRDASQIKMEVINSVPWVTFSVSQGAEVHQDTVYASSWNATTSTWTKTTVSGYNQATCFGATACTSIAAGPNDLIGVGTTPTIVVIQANKSLASQPQEVYVGQYSSSWTQLGGMLNVPSADAPTCTTCTAAEGVAIGTDGTSPFVVFNEYQIGTTSTNMASGTTYIPNSGQVIVEKWNGSAWINPVTGNPWQPFCTPSTAVGCDNSLNTSNANWATGVSTIYVGGSLYIAFTEHAISGLAKLVFQKLTGSSLTTISSDLRRDTTNGYAFETALATDGTNVYLAWDEQTKGAVDKIYVDKYNGSTTTTLGSALNADATNGSAKHVDLVVLNGQPVAMWQEIQVGQVSQIYSKQWNGTTWTIAYGGTAPTANPAPAAINFGNINVGSTSSPQTIALQNIGNANLVVNASSATPKGVALSGTNAADYTISSDACSGATVAASTQCNVNITFTPSASGSRTATLTFTDNSNGIAGSQQNVSLSGAGVTPGAPVMNLSATFLSFGNQTVNTSSAQQSVTVTNTGTASMTISSIVLTGTHSADYSQNNNCPGTLVINASCVINVIFTPLATGSRPATVSITDNASGSPHTVSLTGTGTAVPVTYATLITQEALPGTNGTQVTGVIRTLEPVTVGLPLNDSFAVSSTNLLGCTGSSKCQFRQLATWPDTNLKWVEFSYVDSVAANAQDTSVSLGNGAGNVGANIATDNGTTITINTGANGCTYIVNKKNFDMLHSVVCNSKTIINGGSNGLILAGPAWTGTATTCTYASTCTANYTSANDSASVCTIEKNGSVLAELKCTGGLKDGSGNQYMGFLVRLTFYTGNERVQATVSLKNDYDGASGSFQASYLGYQSFKVSLATNLVGTNNWTFGDDGTTNASCGTSGFCTGNFSTGTSAYLYQGYASGQYFDLTSYNSNLRFSTAAQAAAATDITRNTSLAYAQDGYIIVNPSNAIVMSNTSAVVPTKTMGWADVYDSTTNTGVEIGTPYMAANWPRSLEIRNSGKEIDIGISPDQSLWTGVCTAGITPCQKIYYQPWPYFKVADIYLNFHDSNTNNYSESGLTRQTNDYLRMQYPMAARASVAYYNGSGTLPYPMPNPTAVDSYLSGIVAPYGTLAPFKDCTFISTRFWDWSQGSANNQTDWRYSNLVNRWIERGFTSCYAYTRWFDRMQEQISWTRSDDVQTCTVGAVTYKGWSCHLTPTDFGAYWGNISKCQLNNANNCNDNAGILPNNCTVGTGCSGGIVDPITDENSSGRHFHWWSAIYDYLMTGDEDLGDMIRNGPVDLFTSIGTANNSTALTANGNRTNTPYQFRSWQSSGTNNYVGESGGYGTQFTNLAELLTFENETGDTADAAFTQDIVNNLINAMTTVDPCATTGTGSLNQNWPNGCTPVYDGSQTGLEGRGFSAYRGVFMAPRDHNNSARAVPASGQNLSASSSGIGYPACGSSCTFVRSSEPFMEATLVDGIWKLTNVEGSTWGNYQTLRDQVYGAAYNIDQTNYLSNLASGNVITSQLVYTMAFDQPNSLAYFGQSSGAADNNGLGPPASHIWSIWAQYTGDTSTWLQHFQNNVINFISNSSYNPNYNQNDWYSYGMYDWDTTIYYILNPPVYHLQTVCSGAWTGAGCSKSYNAGTGKWTLTWSAPSGITQYLLKQHSTLNIVDNIGWNVATNQPIDVNVATDYPWFSAAYAATQPASNVTTIQETAPSTASFMLKAYVGGAPPVSGPHKITGNRMSGGRIQ